MSAVLRITAAAATGCFALGVAFGATVLFPARLAAEEARRLERGALGSRCAGCASSACNRRRVLRTTRRRRGPVATTVTHTWPVSRSSTVAPKMMFVSSVAACAHDLGRLVHLEQREVVAAGDREQDAAGADDLRVDQRRAQRALGGLARAVRPRSR